MIDAKEQMAEHPGRLPSDLPAVTYTFVWLYLVPMGDAAACPWVV